MVKLNHDERKMLNDIHKQYPRFSEILKTWRDAEVANLIFANSGTTGVLQGRAQAVSELLSSMSASV